MEQPLGQRWSNEKVGTQSDSCKAEGMGTGASMGQGAQAAQGSCGPTLTVVQAAVERQEPGGNWGGQTERGTVDKTVARAGDDAPHAAGTQLQTWHWRQ